MYSEVYSFSACFASRSVLFEVCFFFFVGRSEEQTLALVVRIFYYVKLNISRVVVMIFMRLFATTRASSPSFECDFFSSVRCSLEFMVPESAEIW